MDHDLLRDIVAGIPEGRWASYGDVARAAGGTDDAVRAAVAYVAGMTDRYACRQAVAVLGWDPAKLPQGVT